MSGLHPPPPRSRHQNSKLPCCFLLLALPPPSPLSALNPYPCLHQHHPSETQISPLALPSFGTRQHLKSSPHECPLSTPHALPPRPPHAPTLTQRHTHHHT